MMRVCIGAAVGVLLVFWATHAPGDERRGAPGELARFGDRAIMAPDLASYWFERYPKEYAESLDELLDERIARSASRRWGIVVPPDVLAAGVEAERKARAALVRRVFGEEATLETWVRDGYDMDVSTWLASIVTPRLEGALLVQRVVRADGRSRPRLHARLLVTSDISRAESLKRKIQAGADFSLVALKESEDATKRTGGTLPPLQRGDMAALPRIEQALFAAQPGALLGPFRVEAGGRTWFHLYKVMGRDEAWTQRGPALQEALEADLRREPVTAAERDTWRARLRAGGRVRYFRPDGSPWLPASWR